ncbi:MAG: restriction endonuclease subunit S, partial [Xanthobacteraceae bacterium]|nr:restriction endonuclease subunit S [Xanthobacteraceae bacterium]
AWQPKPGRDSTYRCGKSVQTTGTTSERTAQAVPDDDLRVELSRAATSNPLPTNWCWTSVGSVFGVYVGATPSRKRPEFWGGTISWVSSGEVAFCKIETTHETITNVGLDNASTRVHPPGTILVGMIGEGKTRGQAAILGIHAANNQNCAAIRVSEAGYSSEYIFWHFWAAYERTRGIGAGNNQPALNKDRVQRILIPLAPVGEAAEIARRIETAFRWIDRLASEATSAHRLINQLDQAILGKAFQGELVPKDPNDEPASTLLERIQAERTASVTGEDGNGTRPRKRGRVSRRNEG